MKGKRGAANLRIHPPRKGERRERKAERGRRQKGGEVFWKVGEKKKEMVTLKHHTPKEEILLLTFISSLMEEQGCGGKCGLVAADLVWREVLAWGKKKIDSANIRPPERMGKEVSGPEAKKVGGGLRAKEERERSNGEDEKENGDWCPV